jgi:hypothetical protein
LGFSGPNCKKTPEYAYFLQISRIFWDCPQIPFKMSRGMHKDTGKPQHCQYCHSCQSGDRCGAIRQKLILKARFRQELATEKQNYEGEYNHLVANSKSLMNALL